MAHYNCERQATCKAGTQLDAEYFESMCDAAEALENLLEFAPPDTPHLDRCRNAFTALRQTLGEIGPTLVRSGTILAYEITASEDGKDDRHFEYYGKNKEDALSWLLRRYFVAPEEADIEESEISPVFRVQYHERNLAVEIKQVPSTN